MEGFEAAQVSTWPLKVDVERKGNLCASHLKGRQSITHCNVSFHFIFSVNTHDNHTFESKIRTYSHVHEVRVPPHF